MARVEAHVADWHTGRSSGYGILVVECCCADSHQRLWLWSNSRFGCSSQLRILLLFPYCSIQWCSYLVYRSELWCRKVRPCKPYILDLLRISSVDLRFGKLVVHMAVSLCAESILYRPYGYRLWQHKNAHGSCLPVYCCHLRDSGLCNARYGQVC